jgi:hypothetical protein
LQGILSYNRALNRGGNSEQMMVKRGSASEPEATDSGVSIWDPLKPNVYTLPEDARK